MRKRNGQGPGEYVTDVTEGVHCCEDLPDPIIELIDRDATHADCPECGKSAPRLRRMHKILHDLGDPRSGHPRDLSVSYAQFHCGPCGCYFTSDLSDLCPSRGQYTLGVIDQAVRLVAEDNIPYRSATWNLWRDHRVFVPFGTIQNWVEAAGEKSGCPGREVPPRPGPAVLQRLYRRG